MAVAFGSVTSLTRNPTVGGVESFTFTKPTGLSVGDLMVAVMGNNGQSANDMTAPNVSWATVATANDGGNYGIRAFVKVADSADVAASNFTFTNNVGINDTFAGFLARFTGSSFGGAGNVIITTDVNNSAVSSHTFTPGITPTNTDSMLMLGAWVRGTTTNVQSYAITNNNPSWTERVDVFMSDGDDAAIAMATAIPTSASDTGDYSLSLGVSREAIGFLLAIFESVGANGNHPILTSTSEIFPHTISVGTTASHPLLEMESEIFANKGKSQEVTQWTDTEKGNKTWTNQKK